jgi:hypothetical protein
MVSKKAYRNSVTGYQAMKNIVSQNATQFSTEILKAFVKIMGIYPIGSHVLVNDGTVAKIVQGNTEAPLRPVIQIMMGSSGNEIENGPIIDLRSDINRKFFIVRAVDYRNGKLKS